MNRIMIDADKCKGCKNCSIACMKAHPPEAETFALDNPKFESRNIILLNGEKKYKPLFCRHCDKPSCVATCMSGAMSKDAKSGHVTCDKEKCGLCFMCVMNCPFGVLKPERTGNTYVVKCDFCQEHNSEPSCVKLCPTGAISLKEVD